MRYGIVTRGELWFVAFYTFAGEEEILMKTYEKKRFWTRRGAEKSLQEILRIDRGKFEWKVVKLRDYYKTHERRVRDPYGQKTITL